MASACGDIRRVLAHSMRTELGPALDHVSVVRGEGFHAGDLIVPAALVTSADRSHAAVREPLLVMNKL